MLKWLGQGPLTAVEAELETAVARNFVATRLVAQGQALTEALGLAMAESLGSER